MSYLSAGSWGARQGPRLVRRALDRERTAAFAAVILVELLLLSLSAGSYVLLLRLGLHDPTWVRVLVMGSFLYMALASVAMLAEAVTRWWWSRRRPGRLSLLTAPSGAPATAVPRSRASLVTPLGFALVNTCWCLGMATTSVATPWLAALFGLLSVLAGLMLLPFVLGRAAAGGVYLTPAGIEHRWGVRTSFHLWEGFVVPEETVPFSLHRRDRATQEKGFPVDVPMDSTDQVRPDQVAAPTPYLVLEASELVALLAMYAGSPTRQQHLGTRASLAWQPVPEQTPGSRAP